MRTYVKKPEMHLFVKRVINTIINPDGREVKVCQWQKAIFPVNIGSRKNPNKDIIQAAWVPEGEEQFLR